LVRNEGGGDGEGNSGQHLEKSGAVANVITVRANPVSNIGQQSDFSKKYQQQ
jgi:hypothetical protein